MQQTLTIIRGLPGSGKSTLAKKITDIHPNVPIMILEADQFYIHQRGCVKKYEFNYDLIGDAHKYCQGMTAYWLNQGWSVIVSNTFTQKCELDSYVGIACRTDVPMNIIECVNTYENVHKVPCEVIERMQRQWDEFDELDIPHYYCTSTDFKTLQAMTSFISLGTGARFEKRKEYNVKYKVKI